MNGEVDIDLRVAERYRRLIGPASPGGALPGGADRHQPMPSVPDVTPAGQSPPAADC